MKQHKYCIQEQVERLLFLIILVLLSLGIAIKLLPIQAIVNMKHVTILCYFMAIIFTIVLISITFFEYRFYKGTHYGVVYFTIMHGLRRQLLDNEIYEVDNLENYHVPKITIHLSSDLQTGTLEITNSLHFNKKLIDLDISSALGAYVLERAYYSEDSNSIIYEFYNHKSKHSEIINIAEEFRKHTYPYDNDHLMLDTHTPIKLQHMLIVGATGSGKTYLLYSLILQMLAKVCSYKLFFADRKKSSLWVVGETLNLQHNSHTTNGILSDLDEFCSLMHEREEELSKLLTTKLDADYATFGLSPYVFVIDEFAALAGEIATMDKATRDAFSSQIKDIVLMGRQLGFFLIIVMQKSDANSIPTMIRDSLTCKVVLGNAEETTYITAFGQGTEIPQRNFRIGEGLYTEVATTSQPRVFTVPTMNFNILEAFKELRRDVGYVITPVRDN